jgi:hypothetical protein
LKQWIKEAEKLNPLQEEGFVIRDAQWRRITIQSSLYKELHKLKEMVIEKDKKIAMVHIILQTTVCHPSISLTFFRTAV